MILQRLVASENDAVLERKHGGRPFHLFACHP